MMERIKRIVACDDDEGWGKTEDLRNWGKKIAEEAIRDSFKSSCESFSILTSFHLPKISIERQDHDHATPDEEEYRRYQ